MDKTKTPDNLTLSGAATLDLTAAKDGQPQRPTFEIDAYQGGVLRLSGWYSPVVIDLAGLRAGARTTILLDHDATQIVGQGKATISATGVKVSGSVTGDYEDKGEPAGKVVAHARGGFQWAASIGASVERVEKVEAGGKVTVNGREFVGPLSVVRAGRLGEVSFVGVGADETATARVAASAGKYLEDEDFAAWLAAHGWAAGSVTAEQAEALFARFQARH